MEARVIIVSSQKSNRSENTIWTVAITGEQKPKAYCKSAYKAMRFAFLLKQQTGLYISENCLARLSHEVAATKAARAAEVKERVQKFAEEHSVDNVLAQQPEPQAQQPKKQRKPRAKKNKSAEDSAKVVPLS